MNHPKKEIKYKGKVVFEKRCVSYFKRIPKEYVENEACFIFINNGEFSVRSAFQYFQFSKGHGLLAKCANFFFEADKRQHTESDYIEVIGIIFYPDIVNELFDFDISNSNHTVNFNLKKVKINHLLENFRESISILQDNPEIADEAFIGLKIKEFITLLSKTDNAPSHLDFLHSMFVLEEFNFKNAIKKNLYSNLSLSELATLTNMSLSSFKRKFKDVFNESPSKYINRKKIEKATKKIRFKENRITDICYEIGYDSIASFNRNFKKYTGVTPTQYRLDFIE